MVVVLSMETSENHTEIYADLMRTRFEFSQNPPIYGLNVCLIPVYLRLKKKI